MKFDVIFLLLFGAVCHSAPHEGLPLLNPGGIGGIFEGPGSETIIRGPDGSEITSEEKSGAVIRDDALSNKPIVVAEPEVAAPVLAEERIIHTGPSSVASPSLVAAGEAFINGPAISSTGAPIPSLAPVSLSSPTPLLTGETYGVSGQGYIDGALAPPISPSATPIQSLAPIEIVEQDPHIIETEIIEAPAVETDENVDIKGSSGRIITKGSASIVSGPVSTTITEPRKIIVAPPKIAIGTPVVATATIPIKDAPLLPLSAVSLGAPLSSALSYSTTATPIADSQYSTSIAPLLSLPTEIDTSRINLGAGAPRESIPVIEYSASNGVISGQNLAPVSAYSSTEAPAVISSTISTINTGNFVTSEAPAVPAPATYLLPPPAPTNAASISSYNIQKIPRIEDSIAVDGRVDMGKANSETYQIPQVLSMALSRFYRKSLPKDNQNAVVIDDKLGELAQNEISSSYFSTPDLSEAKYIAPALARNGIDASQVNLAPVPLSQVRRLPDGGLQGNYYKRSADPRK